MRNIQSNFESALGTGFPKEPLLLFVVAENKQTPEWLELHHRPAASVTDGTLVPLAGEHYLHHTHARRSLSRSDIGRLGGGSAEGAREGVHGGRPTSCRSAGSDGKVCQKPFCVT